MGDEGSTKVSVVTESAGPPSSSSPPPLPRSKIVYFSLGHILNDLCASVWFSYLLVVMHKVLGLQSWKAATILLSGQIADAIATPLVGIYSDQSKLEEGGGERGRRGDRSWIGWG